MRKTSDPSKALGEQARAILDRIEATTADIEQSITRTKEDWRALGQLLLDIETVLPSPNAQHRWIKAHKLDTGLARHSSVRSHAKWLARNWAALKDCKALGDAYHPTELRRRWLALQKSNASWEKRLLGHVLPQEVVEAARALECYGGQIAHLGRMTLREDTLGRGTVKDLQDYLQKAQAAIAVLVAYVASDKFKDPTPAQRERLRYDYGHEPSSDDELAEDTESSTIH